MLQTGVTTLSRVLDSDSVRIIVPAGAVGPGQATVPGERLTWHFVADTVNDFAWVTAKKLVYAATRATIPTKGRVPIHMYYLPGDSALYADAGQITLQFRHTTATVPAVTITGTSNAFVTRPFGLAFRGADAATAIQHGTLPTSALLAAAGDAFTMTLAAYRWAVAEDDGTGSPLAGADITDNADVLRQREAMRLLQARLAELLRAFVEQIEAHRALVGMAYTHLQPAEPTTLSPSRIAWVRAALSSSTMALNASPVGSTPTLANTPSRP